MSVPMSGFSRRQFMRALSMPLCRGSASSMLGAFCHALPTSLSREAVPDKVLFEQVPPSVSGIRWKHVSGRSSEYYLPETAGAGCAFLDYDNDGWMDIYLVNSGHCDFYDP